MEIQVFRHENLNMYKPASSTAEQFEKSALSSSTSSGRSAIPSRTSLELRDCGCVRRRDDRRTGGFSSADVVTE